MTIRIKRVYDPPLPEDGFRVLVDRLWPRGLARADARLDAWLREVAPSHRLRRWFGHDPTKWEEFRHRYAEELLAPEAAAALEHLRALAVDEILTLLYAATDRLHNNAAALREYLITLTNKEKS